MAESRTRCSSAFTPETMRSVRLQEQPWIETADLGTWGRAALLAEYDAEDDIIRVNARAVECVRNVLGDAEAERFIACAVAHERYHRAHPGAAEDDAHRFAAAECGVDPRRFEALFVKK